MLTQLINTIDAKLGPGDRFHLAPTTLDNEERLRGSQDVGDQLIEQAEAVKLGLGDTKDSQAAGKFVCSADPAHDASEENFPEWLKPRPEEAQEARCGPVDRVTVHEASLAAARDEDAGSSVAAALPLDAGETIQGRKGPDVAGAEEETGGEGEADAVVQEADNLGAMGVRLKRLGRMQEAEQQFREASDIYKAKLGREGDVRIGYMLHELGLCVWATGRRLQAARYLTRALKIKEAKLGLGHVQVG